jgi:hypothetical protein
VLPLGLVGRWELAFASVGQEAWEWASAPGWLSEARELKSDRHSERRAWGQAARLSA